MPPLSVVIPTLNESKDIRKVINSVKSLATEILVIDSGSTDDTVKIAKNLGAKVTPHPFSDFASTRNFGDSLAQTDWVLSADADMEVPSLLQEEIKNLPDTPTVYRIGRLNIIWGKPIYHTDWSPSDDRHIRLYHRSLGSWHGKVHEQFQSAAKPKTLSHHFIHHNYQTVNEFIDKLNHYSDIASQTTSSSWLNFFWSPLRDFLKRYLYKLGFLDGYRGLFLSYLQAIYYLSLGIKQKTK